MPLSKEEHRPQGNRPPNAAEPGGLDNAQAAEPGALSLDLPLRPAPSGDIAKKEPAIDQALMKAETSIQDEVASSQQEPKGPAFVEGTIPQKALRKRRQLPVPQLTSARRLQESSIEELLSQSQLPIKEMVEHISSRPPRSPTPELKGPVVNDDRPQQVNHAATQPLVPQASSAPQKPVTPAKPSRAAPPPTRRRSSAAREHERLLRKLDEERLARNRHQLVQQFASNIETSMLARHSAPTSVLFVTEPEDLPAVCNTSAEDSEITAVLESRLRIPKKNDVERLVYALVPTRSDQAIEDAEFLGQIWASVASSSYVYRHHRLC
jgi:hypothetical protein